MRLSKFILVFALLPATLVLQTAFFSHTSDATENTSPWLSEQAPIIEEVPGSIPAPTGNGIYPLSVTSRIPCFDTEIVTRTAKPWLFIEKQSHQNCTVSTRFGSVSWDGYLQRPDSDVYGKIVNGSGRATALFRTPNTDTGIGYGRASTYGRQIYMYKNLSGRLTSTKNTWGDVKHYLPAPDEVIKNPSSGDPLYINLNSINISPNGKWLSGDVPHHGLVRVNISSGEAMLFGEKLPYGGGLSPGTLTAISADGRYFLVGSERLDKVEVYDLNTCSAEPNPVSKIHECESVDLFNEISGHVDGYSTVVWARFRSNYTLEFNILGYTDDVRYIKKYLVTAFGQKTAGFPYLALGDSYASGEGAYKYKAFTDVTDNKCHLSTVSYPYLISSTLGFSLTESVACSGAVVHDINHHNIENTYNDGGAQAKGKSDPKTFDTEIYGNFLPGYRVQKEFISRKSPEIITLSIGGNDIGFGDIIARCLDTDTCYDSYEDRYELAQLVRNQFDSLVEVYEEVKQGSIVNPRVYVIGYPQIAEPDGNCANNVRLNEQELEFAQDLISYLNSVIQKASEKAGVFYVDTEDAFLGSRLCETESWAIAVNGLTRGDDRVNFGPVHGPIGNESYHPNEKGHSLFKDTILQKTQNFTAEMPTPNPYATPNNIYDGMALLSGRHKSNRAIRSLRHISGTDGGLLRYGENLWSMSPAGSSFKVGSTVKGWLNSEPFYLGEFMVQTDGSVKIIATIPNDFPAGIHTLHLYGENSSGEEIDMFKTVYVADGSEGQCVVVPDSGIDYDQDGIDDACDGFIGQKPTASSTPAKTTPEQSSQATSATINDLALSTVASDTTVLGESTTRPTTPEQTEETVLTSNTTAQTSTQKPANPTHANYTWLWILAIGIILAIGLTLILL